MWTVSSHAANACSGEMSAKTIVLSPAKKAASCEKRKRFEARRCSCHQPRAYRALKIAVGINTDVLGSQELSIAFEIVSMAVSLSEFDAVNKYEQVEQWQVDHRCVREPFGGKLRSRHRELISEVIKANAENNCRRQIESSRVGNKGEQQTRDYQ